MYAGLYDYDSLKCTHLYVHACVTECNSPACGRPNCCASLSAQVLPDRSPLVLLIQFLSRIFVIILPFCALRNAIFLSTARLLAMSTVDLETLLLFASCRDLYMISVSCIYLSFDLTLV